MILTLLLIAFGVFAVALMFMGWRNSTENFFYKQAKDALVRSTAKLAAKVDRFCTYRRSFVAS